MSDPSVILIRKRLPVHNKADVLVNDQDLNHIIKGIKHYHGVHKPDYDGIAEEFWTGDAESTSRQLFDFQKKYVKYKVEPESDQTIKSPGRIINEGYGDCKHYSSFISGVVDSLNRKGYPIEAHYKFVSDDPSRDVHHVFAVVRGSGKEMWVDPVLQTFDERPNFFNEKDVFFNNGIGRLTYLSGTDAAIGKKKKHHKSFKELMHNFGKSIEKAVHDTGKGIEKAGYEISHVALKVGMAPARNAFLALVDLNAFNIAQRMHNTLVAGGQKAHDLKQKWRDLGGDEKKLASAIHNGMKHKAFYHHKASPKKVNGIGCSSHIGMGATYHSRWITTHPHQWHKEYLQPRLHPRRNRRAHRGLHDHADRFHHPLHDHADRFHHPLHDHADPRGGLKMHADPHVSGAYVGEPISIGALLALAGAIIGALSKFFSKDPQSDAAMSQGATDGTMDLATKAAAADAGEGAAKADALNTITTPTAGADASMSISTGVDEHGQPQVTVHDVRHPALQNAAQPDGGAGADAIADEGGGVVATSPGGGSNLPATQDAPAGPGIIQKVEDFAKQHWKQGLIVIGVGIALFKGPAIIKSLTKKRR